MIGLLYKEYLKIYCRYLKKNDDNYLQFKKGFLWLLYLQHFHWLVTLLKEKLNFVL